MVSEIQIFEPDRFASAIASLSNRELATFVSKAGPIAPVTRHARAVSAETLRRHERFGLAFSQNHLSRGNFARETDWARYAQEVLPPVDELAAQRRFALAAATVPAEREAITGLVAYLAKVLASAGGSAGAERVSAIVDTLADHEDDRTIYGRVITGFSVPVIQVAARQVLENSKWLPAPAELLSECLTARQFFYAVAFAAKKQIELLGEVREALASPTAEHPVDAVEIDF